MPQKEQRGKVNFANNSIMTAEPFRYLNLLNKLNCHKIKFTSYWFKEKTSVI